MSAVPAVTSKKRFFERVKQYDHYRRAVLVALIIGIPLLIILAAFSTDGLFYLLSPEILIQFFINFFLFANFIAIMLSCSAYFGRLADLIRSIFKKHDYYGIARPLKKHRAEFIGTILGLALGIAIAIGLYILDYAIPFKATLKAFACILYVLRQCSIFGGLGNRTSRLFDSKSRPMSEKVVVGTGTTLGLALGIALFVGMATSYIVLSGFISIFTGGLGVPPLIAGFIFACTVASTVASSCDYLAKSLSYLRTRFFKEKTNEFVKSTATLRFHEYRGSFAGVCTGLVVSAAIIIALTALPPHLIGLSLAGLAASAFITVSAISIFGSMFSRIGRLIDGVTDKHAKLQKEELEKQNGKTPGETPGPPKPEQAPKPVPAQPEPHHGYVTPRSSTPEPPKAAPAPQYPAYPDDYHFGTGTTPPPTTSRESAPSWRVPANEDNTKTSKQGMFATRRIAIRTLAAKVQNKSNTQGMYAERRKAIRALPTEVRNNSIAAPAA